MKKIVSIMCLALAMIMVMTAFAACGNSGSSEDDTIEGTYYLIEASSGTEVFDKDYLYEAGLQDSTMIISGNVAVIDVGGDVEQVTVDTEANTMYDETGYEVPYTFDGKTLTLSRDGMKLVFEKSGSTIVSMDGTYDLIEVSYGTEVFDRDDLDELGMNGEKIVIKGTSATLYNVLGNGEEFTINTATGMLTDDTGYKAPYTFSGNTFVINENGLKMVFEKR